VPDAPQGPPLDSARHPLACRLLLSILFLDPPNHLPSPAGASLLAALDSLGCTLLGRCQIPQLVQTAARHAPDMVVCGWPVFDTTLRAVLAELAPTTALLVVGGGDDDTTLQRAVQAGVQGWVSDLAAPADAAAMALQTRRLGAEIVLARARHAAQAAARAALADALERLDERKWVERAKGVLMAARQISEDDAFRLLRGASMHTNLRVGVVSRSVIEAAQQAEALNRAGQLRMLSQRLVRLLAQWAAAVQTRRSRELLAESQARVVDNLARLQSLPLAAPATLALAEVSAAWSALQPMLIAKPGPALLRQADAQAERLLEHAEQLAGAIDAAGSGPAVHIVNVCGRQRMRVQRAAKAALLGALLDDDAARSQLALTQAEFEAALTLLEHAPLSSAEIRDALAAARAEWLRMAPGLDDARTDAARQALARGSEELLALFERLTALYEHSLQVIMGG